MATDRTDPDDVNSGDPLPASWLNGLPRGRIGRDTLTSNSSGTATTETICSVTVTVAADRTLTISAGVTLRSDLPGGASARILEDGTQIQRKNTDIFEAGTDLFIALMIETQPSAGSHTYSLVTGVSGTDGNTVTAIANGGSGSHGVTVLYVDDSGPSY